MARPKLEIDEEQVLELAKIQCTLEEIASVIGTTRQTISSRFLHIIEKGREEGKKSLRRSMYDKAVKDGNVVMMIWLSKQYLGMSEKVQEHVVKEVVNLGGEEFEKLKRELSRDLQLIQEASPPKPITDESGSDPRGQAN